MNENLICKICEYYQCNLEIANIIFKSAIQNGNLADLEKTIDTAEKG